MRYSLKTDRGIIRPSNQDSCFCGSLDESSAFAVVCDGMGGGKAGDIASDIAVKTISERIMNSWRANMTASSVINLITTSVTAANICIYDSAAEDPNRAGMGTTVVAAVINDGKVVVAHAGDSRAYVSGKGLRSITKDHSLVQDMVDAGQLTALQAANHPNKNFITRALGIDEHIDVDFTEFVLEKNDKLLLCTDGLTNFLSEEDIFRILSENPTEKTAEMLVSSAIENGGGDNVTAVVVSM